MNRLNPPLAYSHLLEMLGKRHTLPRQRDDWDQPSDFAKVHIVALVALMHHLHAQEHDDLSYIILYETALDAP